jgi:hypothetical protein
VSERREIERERQRERERERERESDLERERERRQIERERDPHILRAGQISRARGISPPVAHITCKWVWLFLRARGGLTARRTHYM